MKHALFGAALALMAGAAPAFAELTDIRFTLGWKTQGSDAPFLLALHKGYFEQEGLNVTIDQGEGSAATRSSRMPPPVPAKRQSWCTSFGTDHRLQL